VSRVNLTTPKSGQSYSRQITIRVPHSYVPTPSPARTSPPAPTPAPLEPPAVPVPTNTAGGGRCPCDDSDPPVGGTAWLKCAKAYPASLCPGNGVLP
jgi:hypothetical protein